MNKNKFINWCFFGNGIYFMIALIIVISIVLALLFPNALGNFVEWWIENE